MWNSHREKVFVEDAVREIGMAVEGVYTIKISIYAQQENRCDDAHNRKVV